MSDKIVTDALVEKAARAAHEASKSCMSGEFVCPYDVAAYMTRAALEAVAPDIALREREAEVRGIETAAHLAGGENYEEPEATTLCLRPLLDNLRALAERVRRGER